MSRACTVVKATIVPAVMGTSPRMRNAETRYTIAGMMARNICTVAKNHCPLICKRTWRPTWVSFSALYRPVSAFCWLKLLASRMPETDSVSWVIAVMSLSDSCVFVAMRARTWPTWRCAITRIGMRITATSVSCHESRSMEMKAATTVTVLPSTLDTVFVSTPATPPTSFCSRDWIAPVLVLVKNASSIRWRCSNRRMRSAPMTLFPTVAVSQVCQTPSPALTMKITTIRPTTSASSGTSGPCPGGKSPWSKATFVSSGGSTVSPAPTTTSTTVRRRALLCGAKRSPIRRSRSGTLGAVSFSLRCADASPPPIMRPPRPGCIPLTGSLYVSSDGR